MSKITTPIASTPRPPDKTIVLENDRLRVDIAMPGELYAGARFDWTAFITQITLDRRHTFCAPEAVDGTGTGGSGLCSEFGIRLAVAFDEASPGEQFVKPGVGLLKRPDGRPYDFTYPYDVTPFHCAVAIERDHVIFTTEPLECRGYALRTVRTVRVEQEQLVIDNLAENVGERRIITDEYCHNFIALGGRKPGSGTHLRVPQTLRSTDPVVGLQMSDATIAWTGVLTQTFYAAFGGFEADDTWWWKLTDTEAGLSIGEKVDFTPRRFAVYATDRIVSPEVFIGIDLAPGHVQRWQRQFTFQSL